MTYVSAGPVELAVVLNVEVDDVNGTAAVVLDNLVRTVVSTTTDDPGLGASLIVLDGKSVLADVLPPDVLKSAVTGAVDTLSLVLADDDVAESGALVEVEDGVLVVTLALTTASTAATVVPVPLTVEDLAGLDLNDCLVGLGANSLRNTTGETVAGHGGGKESCNSSEDGRGLHFEKLVVEANVV